MEPGGNPGAEAIKKNGWLRAHRYLILRRISQIGILALFLLGPLAGIWIVKGNLASSLTLDVLPLTDPLVLLQVVFVAGLAIASAIDPICKAPPLIGSYQRISKVPLTFARLR